MPGLPEAGQGDGHGAGAGADHSGRQGGGRRAVQVQPHCGGHQADPRPDRPHQGRRPAGVQLGQAAGGE